MVSQNALAAPTCGTETPREGAASVGYETNIIFKHDLGDSHGNIKSAQHFYILSYGVFDWLSFDGRMGAGDLLQKGGVHPKVHYDYGFAGGYGFRILVLEDVKNRVRIVAGFHHISVHPNNRALNGDKYESLLDDWQASVVSSKDIGAFSPFLGVKASRQDLVYKVNETDRKRRPPLYYGGVVAGASLKLPGDISLRLEGRFIDESALSTAVYYTF